MARACAEKARDTTLDDEKYNWPHRGAVRIDRTCVVVTALCNQPKVFASDLGDDQSRYLYNNNMLRTEIAVYSINSRRVFHT